jgi:hypothetical protein
MCTPSQTSDAYIDSKLLPFCMRLCGIFKVWRCCICIRGCSGAANHLPKAAEFKLHTVIVRNFDTDHFALIKNELTPCTTSKSTDEKGTLSLLTVSYCALPCACRCPLSSRLTTLAILEVKTCARGGVFQSTRVDLLLSVPAL